MITITRKIIGSIKLEPDATAPTAAAGVVYFDSGDTKLKVCEDGASFVDVGTGAAGGGAALLLPQVTFNDSTSYVRGQFALNVENVRVDVVASTFSVNSSYIDVVPLDNGHFAQLWADGDDGSKLYIQIFREDKTSWVAGAAFTTGQAEYIRGAVLQDGNLAIVYKDTTSGRAAIQIVTPRTTSVKAHTLVSTSTNTNWEDITPLLDGGFAIIYQDGTSGLKMMTFDAEGTEVLGETSIFATSASYPGVCTTKNGDIAIAFRDVTGNNGRYKIVDIDGVDVLAVTTFESVQCTWLDICTLANGNLAIAYNQASATECKVRVMDLEGNSVGANAWDTDAGSYIRIAPLSTGGAVVVGRPASTGNGAIVDERSNVVDTFQFLGSSSSYNAVGQLKNGYFVVAYHEASTNDGYSLIYSFRPAFWEPIKLMNSSADPSDNIEGAIYYNSTTNRVKFNDGTAWSNITQGTATFDAVVEAGGGADYTTLGAAVTAGHKNIFVKDGVTTETGAITLPTNARIIGESKFGTSINMGTYQLICGSGTKIENLEIRSSNTTTDQIRVHNYVMINNCYLRNSSTTNPAGLLGVVGDGGIAYSDVQIVSCFIRNLAGTSNVPNRIGIRQGSASGTRWKIDRCTFAGESASYQVKAIQLVGSHNNFSNCLITDQATAGDNVVILAGDRNTVTGITTTNTCAGDFAVTSNDNTISAVTCNHGGFDLVISGDGNSVSGFVSAGDIELSSGGDQNIITNSQFAGTCTIASDYNTINGCRIGAVAGGGANTITINSGADNNIVIGNKTDAAISDSGTGTVLANNTVY